jgi:hypothetical protein
MHFYNDEVQAFVERRRSSIKARFDFNDTECRGSPRACPVLGDHREVFPTLNRSTLQSPFDSQLTKHFLLDRKINYL